MWTRKNHGLCSLDWYGLYVPECQAGGEDVETYEKKVHWLQSLIEFKCAVTVTWTSCDVCGEFQVQDMFF